MRRPLVLLAVVLLLGCQRADQPAGEAPGATELVPEAEARALLTALAGATDPTRGEVLDRIVRSGDARFAAPLIELLWATEVGVAPKGGHNARVVALERLTGERLGASWFAWLEWLGGAQLPPPPGFASFKARLIEGIHPAYAGLLSGTIAPQDLVEIHWSGAAPGSIPALVDPATLPASAASWLEPNEPVVGLALGSEARAYPLRILDWHEVANDVVGGVAVCVVSCPLGGTTSAFEAGSAEGRRRFEATGLLLRSTSLLVDDRTGSLWSSVDLRVVARDPTRPDASLDPVPFVLTTWRAWQNQHPGTSVLSQVTGHARPYVPGQPYAEYYLSDQLRFPVPRRGGPLSDKTHVFGVQLGGRSVAYPLRHLTEERVLNDGIGDVPLVLVATRGVIQARHGDPVEPRSYEVGAEVRAYRRGGRRFRATSDPGVVLDERERPWRVRDDALAGPEGETLPRVPGTPAYWFAWHAFFPDTEVRAP